LFRADYLDERKPFQKGMVGWYVLRVNSPDDATRVTKGIDEMFANSPWETKTEAESSFAASWVQQMGNVEFLILSIGGVVFFTLLLVTGNTMAIAVRERTRELAVLKAVGYPDTTLLLLVLGEALVIAVLGGGMGLALAKAFTLRGDPTGGMLPFFYLPPRAVAAGMGLALGIGVISGLTPAVSAMRLRVVDALRRV
jgi:putative ABC transport system permease protein